MGLLTVVGKAADAAKRGSSQCAGLGASAILVALIYLSHIVDSKGCKGWFSLFIHFSGDKWLYPI